MKLPTFLEERKQVNILRKQIPRILEKIQREHKNLLSKESILTRFKRGKLFGVAGEVEIDDYHISYKFTVGISKKSTP